MWTFLTGFDEESREDFWVWTEGGQTFHGSKIRRKGKGIPGRKQLNLANFSATEEECTRTDFPQYFGDEMIRTVF